MIKKWLFSGVLISVVVAVAAVGCAKVTPTPTPAPKATPVAPAPGAKPPGTPAGQTPIPQTPIPFEESIKAYIRGVELEKDFRFAGIRAEAVEVNRLRGIPTHSDGVKAKIAVILLKSGRLSGEQIIEFRDTTGRIYLSLRTYIVRDSETEPMYTELQQLDRKKFTALQEARRKAESDFLAGKPYREPSPSSDEFKITDEEAIPIISKYIKLIIAPYYD